MDRRGSCVGWGVIFFLNVSGLNFFFFFFFSSFINGVISMEYRIQERYLSSSLFYYPSGRFLFPGGGYSELSVYDYSRQETDIHNILSDVFLLALCCVKFNQ